MKKIISILFMFLILSTTVLGFCACTRPEEELIIYNWEEYIYPDFEQDFIDYYKQKTGKDLTITYVTFDTNETMLNRIMNGAGRADLICPSEYAVQRLIAGGYLEKINYFAPENSAQYPNAQNIDTDIVQTISDSFGDDEIDITEYMVPYMWGTLGILYNTDKISPEQAHDAGWGLLWNETSTGEIISEELTGKIFIKDSVRDSYCASVFYLKQKGLLDLEHVNLSANELINSVDDVLMAQAEQVLIAQKSQLKGYAVDFDKDDLITERAYASLAWSGDAMYAIEEAEADGVNLDYFVPEIGGNIWLDGWVIPKTASNKECAKIFIDWMNDPVVAMNNMMEIGYTSAVSQQALKNSQEALQIYYEVYEWAEDEIEEANEYFFDDARRYPLVTDVSLGVMHDFGAKNATITEMWGRVRAAGVAAWDWALYTILVLGTIFGLFFAIVFFRGNRVRKVKIIE